MGKCCFQNSPYAVAAREENSGERLLPNVIVSLPLQRILMRTINGFYALLVLTGSTASANLYFSRFIRSRRTTSRWLGESRAVSPILISPPRS